MGNAAHSWSSASTTALSWTSLLPVWTHRMRCSHRLTSGPRPSEATSEQMTCRILRRSVLLDPSSCEVRDCDADKSPVQPQLACLDMDCACTCACLTSTAVHKHQFHHQFPAVLPAFTSASKAATCRCTAASRDAACLTATSACSGCFSCFSTQALRHQRLHCRPADPVAGAPFLARTLHPRGQSQQRLPAGCE